MTDNTTDKTPTISEATAIFASRDTFEAAIAALIDAGFERADLSVLASHDSLAAAGKPGKPWKDALTALVGELKYEGPLVASGAILLAGGPAAATLAALIGAAVGGVAASEILGEVTASPHTEDFSRALDAGSVILWVRITDEDRARIAQDALTRTGGTNVHIHHRAA